MKKLIIILILILSISCTKNDTIINPSLTSKQVYLMLDGHWTHKSGITLEFNSKTKEYKKNIPTGPLAKGIGTYYVKDSVGRIFLVTDFRHRNLHGTSIYHYIEEIIDMKENSFIRKDLFNSPEEKFYKD